jgi:hypothetical protein
VGKVFVEMLLMTTIRDSENNRKTIERTKNKLKRFLMLSQGKSILTLTWLSYFSLTLSSSI